MYCVENKYVNQLLVFVKHTSNEFVHLKRLLEIYMNNSLLIAIHIHYAMQCNYYSILFAG